MVYDGRIASLRRFKDDVPTVARASSAASASRTSETSRKVTPSSRTRSGKSPAPEHACHRAPRRAPHQGGAVAQGEAAHREVRHLANREHLRCGRGRGGRPGQVAEAHPGGRRRLQGGRASDPDRPHDGALVGAPGRRRGALGGGHRARHGGVRGPADEAGRSSRMRKVDELLREIVAEEMGSSRIPGSVSSPSPRSTRPRPASGHRVLLGDREPRKSHRNRRSPRPRRPARPAAGRAPGAHEVHPGAQIRTRRDDGTGDAAVADPVRARPGAPSSPPGAAPRG